MKNIPNLKTKKLLNILLLIFSMMLSSLEAQNPCSALTPSFVINLTGNPSGVWSSSNVARSNTCCAATNPDQCIYFNLTLDPNVAGIQIDMIGADPAGSLFYDIGCTGSYPGGTIKCISGSGPHQITFCKPGGNKNVYKITSVSKPMFPNDDTTRIGCKKKLITNGIVNTTVLWTAISGTSAAQNAFFDTFLDSTNVASPTYSAPLSYSNIVAPFYIDYKVCGFPIASACGFTATLCDTVRIWNYPVLKATVTPSPATYCNVGPGSGVTLTASATGGLPPYTYEWAVSPSTVFAVGTNTYFASAAGTYNFSLKDHLYSAGSCPNFQTSRTVSVGTVPTVTAGLSQKVCKSSPAANLSGLAANQNGAFWSGGSGTFNPGNNYLNTSYTPSAGELTAGFVKLYLTALGGGGCTNAKDSLNIYYSGPVNASIISGTLGCHNSTTNISASGTGGTLPYTYLWNTAATTSAINVGQGVYSVIISDSLGCTGSINANIVAPSALSLLFNVINVTVNGGNDGSATVTTSGGTAPYTVTWTPGGMNTMAINTLTYGVYSAMVTDANGCQVISSAVINEPRCLGFSSATSGTNATCYQAMDGIASVTVSGGTPAYTYTWNSVPVQNTSVATGLFAGVYSVYIKDSNVPACYQTANVTITEPTALTNVMTHTDVTTVVPGNEGAAASNPFGGTSPYTFLWNTAATTSLISNLTPGSYSVTITDNKGCTKPDNVYINSADCSSLTLNVLTTNVLCNGGNNGSALAVVTGATGSYTVAWSTSTIGLSINNLAAGNYSVLVTDSKGCSEPYNFSVTEPSQLSIGLLPTNVSCNGKGDGTIDLTISGGNIPYNFVWNNGTSSEDQVNLGPGTYSVLVTDANGCSAAGSAVITEPNPLTATASITQSVTCINGSNGAISLNVSGGTPPFVYNWSNSATTQSISNLQAGGYTVTVLDANGCVSPLIIVPLLQPDSVKIVTYTVACPVPGSGQAQAAFTPTGGISGLFQISLDNGSSYQPAGVYTALLNNNSTYSIVLKDGNNCQSLTTFTLFVMPEVKIDSLSFSKCYPVGTLTTQVVVWPTGGDNGPYQVSSDNGSSYQAIGNYTFNANIATSYSVFVKDGRGCISAIKIGTLPSVLDATTTVTSNFNGTQISCFGLSDGSALTSASGGTGTYSYTWSSVPTQSTAAASNLIAGTYSVTIQDGNSCAITQTVILNQPSAISATAGVASNYNGQDISCFGLSDGSATVAASGATSPYTYNWNSNPTQTTTTASNLIAGTYSVIVKDINNCGITKTVILSQPVAITATSSIISNYNGQDISCFGLTDGSASVTTSGGTGAYSYTWSTVPAQNTASANTLGANIYSVTVNDANACSIVKTVLLSQPPQISATTSITSNYNGQDISCFGLTDGSASVTTSGGTGAYSYTWSTVPAQNTASANTLGANIYSVTVNDANGCAITKTVSLSQPSAITSTAGISSNYNGQDISCFNLSDGSATVSANGGTGAYSYTWSSVPTQTNSTASNLGAGTYSITVKDANSCAITQTVILNQPSAISATAGVASNYNGQDISCFGLSDGSATVVASGATSPYTYNWNSNPTQTTTTASNLIAGTYSVIVKDINNCAITKTVILNQPPAITATTSVTSNYNGQDVSCFGLTDGSASVTTSGGTGAYSYTWSTVPAQNTASANTLGANIYSVTVNDANACAIVKTVSLSQPPQMSATTSITSNYNGQDISCFGLTDGSASVITSGGTGAYSYTWSTVPAQNTASANTLGANIYSVTVNDANGCAITKTVSLSQPSAITSTAGISSNYNGQDISCFNLSDGSATVSANGGTGAYSYTWSSVPTQTNSTASNLGAGTYSITVKDANSCAITQTVILNQPSAISATAGVASNYNGQDISCFGLSDGSATVAASGATSPYTYNWNSNPTQTTTTASNLIAGTYSVIVKDINNCAITKTVILNQPPAITATTSVTSNYNGQDITCFGASDGSAVVTASNGTSPYTYTWSTTPAQTTTLATNLSAGNYSIIITDANGCNTTKTITVNQPTPLMVTASITSNYNGSNISCFGLSDGSASVTATGATAPYTYTWNSVPSQSTTTASNLAAGSYSVIVADINGCNVTQTISLTQPLPVNAAITNTSNYNGFNVSCFGYTNASVDITLSGGTGAFTYTWSNNAPTQDINNVGAGNYSVVASDANGCMDTLYVILTEPDKLITSIDSLSNFNGYNVSCFGSTNGTVYVSTSGGVPNYSYQWGSGATTQNLNNIGEGFQYVVVTDLNGCYTHVDTTLLQPSALTQSYMITPPFCNGVSNGSVNLSVSGGVSPVGYQWSNGTTNQDLNNITAGTYTVVYTDANGCKDSTQIIVFDPAGITSEKEVDKIKCYGDTTSNIKIVLKGGTLPYSFSWSNGKSTQNLNSLGSGTYILTATDANGCLFMDTTQISQPEALTIDLYSPVYSGGYNISTYNGNDGSIELTVTGGTSPYSYIWSNGATSKNLSNLSAYFPNPSPYNVIVTDSNGCKASGKIELTQPLILEMPTAYSPNGDGSNDNFIVHGIEVYPNNTLTIFNRWGNVVYTKTGYNNEWDGHSMNGQELPDATYFALLEINKGEKTEIILKGYVELRRK